MVVKEFDAPRDGITNEVEYHGERYAVDGWMEVLHPTTANPIGIYRDKFYAGHTAISQNRYGQGIVTYVGVRYQRDLVNALIQDVANQPIHVPPPGVFMTTRVGNSGRFTFYINMQTRATQVPVARVGWDVLSDQAVGDVIEIDPWDLAIVKES